MEYIDKIKKEPRLIIAALNIIFFFLPWISISVGDWGLDISGNASGFALISDRFSVFFLLLIAIFLLAIPFIPVIKAFTKLLYVAVPLIAIILSFIFTAGVTGSAFGVDVNHGIGFWLSILANLALIVLTFIFDFKINSKTIKQKGLQGVFSDVAGQLTNSASEMASGFSNPKATPANVVCPSCSNSVAQGTKFCPKCGTQLPEAKKCTGCGAELPAGTAFCSNCGTKSE